MLIGAPSPSIRRLRRHGVVAALCALALAPTAHAGAELPLMPLPRSVALEQGVLRLEGRPALQVAGCAAMVTTAIARFERDLASLTGTRMSGAPVPLTINCMASDPKRLTLEAREGYRLTVSSSGIAIQADGETGVLRALATLRQLVSRDAKGPVVPFVRIDDAPRFPWRGLMIDTARHFMAVSTLKRQIDAMELAKLNVLHLHLSDNEAFRVESRRFPKLTQVSAPGGFYTQSEIRDLVRYAAERGVRIVPEFDMPGHMRAVLTAYPELGIAPIAPDDPLIQSKGALNPASERTYKFLESLLAELTPLFPDEYFHVGGDEVSDVAWKDSAEVEALKRREGLADKLDVEAWFHRRVRAMLARHGKRMVGWDEMAERPLPKDMIVQAWRTSNPLATSTVKGNRVILSAGYYLDALRPAEAHYAQDPLDPNAFATMTAEELANTRRNPASAAQVSSGLVATPQPPLTPEQQQLVLGIEAPLWAEAVTDEMLDGRLWPRGLAIGERGWSPAATASDDMYRRLLPAMDQLRALGLLDQARRERLIARLAPDAPEVVRNLVDLVAPVRGFARQVPLLMGAQTELIELVDAASTDGSVARRFRLEVVDYLAGDRSRGALLRSRLAGWRDNEAAFAQIAGGRPLLEAAIPTARNLAALGSYGLAALDAIEAGKPMKPEQVAAARVLFAKLKAFEDASASHSAMATMKQPPANLIILVTPDVAKLVDAAEQGTR